MLSLLVQRLIQSIPLMLGASIVVFAVMRMIPGDPAEILAGPKESPEAVEEIRQDFDLDKPLPVQYVVWLEHVVKGDLGKSYLTQVPVTQLLQERIPATLELTFAAMLLAILVSVPAGTYAAARGGKFDVTMTFFASIFMAIPSFWLGILAIFVFAEQLGWLPPGGRVEILSSPIEGMKTLILPALTLAAFAIASMSRLVKSTMLEVLHEDYVRTARSKGLRQSRVMLRHVLPNALLPVITLASLWFGRLLGGAVITETIFSWPGLGRLILNSIQSRDYVVVQGALLYFVIIFIIVNFLTDVAYGIIDPRIRLSSSQQ
jgi:peptide/nickel transport system permease protein